VYECIDHECTATVTGSVNGGHAHIGPKKSTVRLEAPSCQVTIEFFDADKGQLIKPPFKNSTNPIIIPKGGHKNETVRDDAANGGTSGNPGHYPYTLECKDKDCGGEVVEPPEMIVP
jgi:hypothetical protein